jgi:hypothetical protein
MMRISKEELPLEDIPFDKVVYRIYESDANEYAMKGEPIASDNAQYGCYKCMCRWDNGNQLRWLSFSDVGEIVCQRCHLVEAALRFHHGGSVARARLSGLRSMGTTAVHKSTEDDKVQETPFTDREVPWTPYVLNPEAGPRKTQLVSELYQVAAMALDGTGDTSILGVGLRPDVPKRDVMAFTRTKMRPYEVMMCFGASEHRIKLWARMKGRI